MQLSYELRRGGNRPGPAELWDRFDAAVEALGTALEGVALGAIARAFAELSQVARELADAIEPTTRAPAIAGGRADRETIACCACSSPHSSSERFPLTWACSRWRSR